MGFNSVVFQTCGALIHIEVKGLSYRLATRHVLTLVVDVATSFVDRDVQSRVLVELNTHEDVDVEGLAHGASTGRGR